MRRTLSMIVAVAALVPVVISVSNRTASAINPDLVVIDGQAGDGLIDAHSYSFGPGQFSVEGTRQGIAIVIPDPQGMWAIGLAPATGHAMAPGFYEDAARFVSATTPMVNMTARSSACNVSTGRFVVDEVTFDGADTVTSLVAHWEHHCEDAQPATYGTISWNGSTALSPRDAVGPNNFPDVKIDTIATAKAQTFVNSGADPVDVTSVAVTGTDPGQFIVTADGCSGSSVPAGGQCDVMVAFAPTQMGKSYATLDITAAANPAPPSTTGLPLRGVAVARVATVWLEGEKGDALVGVVHRSLIADRVYASEDHSNVIVSTPMPFASYFALRAAGAVPVKVGTYDASATEATSTTHGLEVFTTNSACVSGIAARMIVREIAFATDGSVSRLVASWEIHCNGSPAASFGAVNYNGTVPFTQRTISPLSNGYPALNVGLSASRTFVVKNNGPGTLKVASAKLSGTNASQFALLGTSCTNITLAVGASCSATVRYAPKVAGAHTAKLTIVDSYAPVGGVGTGQDIVLTGRAVAGFTAFLEGEYDDSWVGPGHVALSAVQVIGTRRSIVISGNEGSDTWQILIFPRSGTTFSTTPVTLATKRYDERDATHAGLSLVWNNLFCRTATGRLAIDYLAFNANGTVKAITARWEYHCGGELESSFGGVRAANLSTFSVPDLTDAVTWDQVPMSTTAITKPVVVSNRGPSPLPVGQVTLQGADAAQFQIVSDACSNRSVSPGGSCTVNVRFVAGTSLGERRARLTVPHAGALLGKGGTGQDVVLLGSVTAPLASNYGELTTVPPARIVDTAAGTGAPKAPLGPQGTLQVQITGRGGVPTTGVSAVVVSVTTRNTSTAGSSITAWSAGQPKPPTVFMVPTPGAAIAGLATVRLGTGGKIQLYNASGSSDVTVDVVGWYSDLNGPDGSRFRTVVPFRMFDTRSGGGNIPLAPIPAGGSLGVGLYQLIAELPPAGITAVALNVTVASATASGSVTVHPGDVARPDTPSVPVTTGRATTNLVIVRVPTDGVLQFFNSAGNTNLAVDLLGYWTAGSGNSGRYIPVTPYRTLDTRTTGGPMISAERWRVRIGGENRVAHDAAAVTLNVVAAAPTTTGALRVYSDEQCFNGPNITTVSFGAGRTVANGAITALSKRRECAVDAGLIDVLNNSPGTTHALIDVWGYFTP